MFFGAYINRGGYEMKNKSNQMQISPFNAEKVKLGGKNALRLIIFIVGGLILFIGVLMTASIVLILPGIVAVLTSIILMYFNSPKSYCTCPDCDYENKIPINVKSHECSRCGQRRPII